MVLGGAGIVTNTDGFGLFPKLKLLTKCWQLHLPFYIYLNPFYGERCLS